MKPFRLARLLRLKEESANAKRLDWALSERDVASADDRVTYSKAQVAAGEEELRGGMLSRRESGGMQSLLGAHRVLDGQREDIDIQRARLEEARLVASEKRLESQAAKREVEALLRLEHRWLQEQRARARRRAARASDEYIASKVSMDRAQAARRTRPAEGAQKGAQSESTEEPTERAAAGPAVDAASKAAGDAHKNTQTDRD